MYKMLSVLFISLKFSYYHYHIILNNSKRLYDFYFFKNNIFSTKTLNLNFFFEKYWYFGDKQMWYYLGFNNVILGLKKKKYFFKHIGNNLTLRNNNVFKQFLGSNYDNKGSNVFWKKKFINIIINFCDWSFFFKNSIQKSKTIFLSANSHPISNTSFSYLKKFDLDEYNDDSIVFNVDISTNTDLNYNKKLLISEFFFFNNSLIYDLDVDNEYFLFFLIKLNTKSSLFKLNKFYFKNTLLFNFNYSLFYPYYFENNMFFRFKNENSVIDSTFSFDKRYSDLSDFIIFNFNEISSLRHLWLKRKVILLLEYRLFFILNFLIFYGITKKKKKYYIKIMKKKTIKNFTKYTYSKVW